MAKTGVAFSGGGLRSASFCSGVLRRLLQTGSRIDYLSCVSGGGVTASAYLDWKFRHAQKDNSEWHKRFFDHMRKRIGVYVIWNNPCYGVLDTLFLLSVVLLLSVIFPVLIWSSFAAPIAFVINVAFGRALRGSFICRINGTVVFDSEADDCETDNKPSALQPVQTLFFALAGSFVFFYVIKSFLGPRLSPFAAVLQTASGFVFLMVSLPWVLQQFSSVMSPVWFQVLIIGGSALVMISLPPFRGMASLVVMVYLYSVIVRWHVLKVPFLISGLKYNPRYFGYLLWTSAGVLIFVPLIGVIQKGLLHACIRWKLQKAFYSKESIGISGWAGISCSDFFPVPERRRPHDMKASSRPLTLGDLEYMKPEFICNVLVDNWQIENAPDKPKYELLMFTPTVIERLDRKKGQLQFEGLLTPSDIELSAAMATSVAAVSLHMGVYQEKANYLRDIQAILGLTFGRDMVVGKTSLVSLITSILLQLIFLGPLLVLPPFRSSEREIWDTNVMVTIWLAVSSVLGVLIAVMPTGSLKPNAFERFVRWSTVYIIHVRFIRDMLNVINIGPSPPPVLSLSDGGHFENLGVLPLFKRRLERIVAVNGGTVDEIHQSADDLLIALELARARLNCSFIGIDGRDVIEDVRHKFVERPPGKQPRYYRFKVEYYDEDSNTGENCKVGEGEVLLLFPRHPTAGTAMGAQKKTWKEFGIDLDPEVWGTGPELEAEEVDRLIGCCCDCCHGTSCGCCSRVLCGMFPNHSTANQCLTPEMFVAYHREGYRVCVEASTEDFLTTDVIAEPNVKVIQVEPV